MKKVGFITSYPTAKTGFSTNIRTLLPWLYRQKCCEIYHLAQGIEDNHPDFQRYPWKTEGVFKNFDVARFQGDEGYKRFVAYGNTSVEKFVTDNKLDVVFHIEDIWSSAEETYLKSNWFPFVKKNFVNWSTADSMPILPQFKTWAKECPNLWFWTSFAEKALKEEDSALYGHVKTVHGCLNTETFHPIVPDVRKQLRDQFSIKDDEIIILHLGRNQLRKLFWANVEALARFKKAYPQYKVRLLFHCCWSEPVGWPLARTRDEAGLKLDDILTTHWCRQCSKFEIKPFVKEEVKCSYCGNEKSQVTAGVDSGINEEELSLIYGVADAASSVFTSGGLEYFNVESLLCGLPLASTPYSCGSDFTDNEFVHTIEGSHTRECNTDFKKFVPDIQSIVKFYRKVCEMDPAKRREWGEKGRQWALNEFNVSIIGQKVKDFIDQAEPLDWSKYEVKDAKKEALKNPNAIIPETVDNIEWLKRLYKNILNMEVSDEDSGLCNWLAQLGKGAKRPDIENYFRKVATDKNNEIQSQSIDNLFEETGKKRLLFVMPQSAGDILWVSSLLKDARGTYPDYDIYFACDPKFFELLDGNPYIYKKIPYIKEFDNLLFLEGAGEHKGHVDIAFLLHVQTQRILTYNHKDDIINYDVEEMGLVKF